MPDDILSIVEAGIQIAKTTPKTRDNVQEIPMQKARTPEEAQVLKERYENVNADISDALEPGERYLTEEEAKARREILKKQREEQGLNIFG